ncbi:MAG: hypothetical protein SFU86_24655 [Pirellulaceae bacterium]|nr:hypothetical protein [Pirellulaceae bacterium]
MALSRNELLADWRAKLADATAAQQVPGRFGWLARVRTRLYRFLLTCYGEGNWTASSPPAPTDDAPRTAVASESPETALLHGKPAKTAGKIQAVLKAVSQANDHPLPSGPHVTGLDPESWFLIATFQGLPQSLRLTTALRKAGIPFDLRTHGQQRQVLVPAYRRMEATEIVASLAGPVDRAATVIKSKRDLVHEILLALALGIPALLVVTVLISQAEDSWRQQNWPGVAVCGLLALGVVATLAFTFATNWLRQMAASIQWTGSWLGARVRGGLHLAALLVSVLVLTVLADIALEERLRESADDWLLIAAICLMTAVTLAIASRWFITPKLAIRRCEPPADSSPGDSDSPPQSLTSIE